MDITPQQARVELAKRELARRQSSGGGNAGVTTPPQSFMQKAGNFATNALPLVGGIAGGIGGGILGAIGGGPPGAYVGAVGGSAAGGAAGEFAKEKIQGQATDPAKIKSTAGQYGALEAVGGPIASVGGKVLEATGAGVAKMFIPKSEVEAGMLQAYKAGTSFLERISGVLGYGGAKAPSTGASAAFEKGLMGTESMLGVKAVKAQNKMWNSIISPALKQSTEKVDVPSFLKEGLDKMIKETPDPTRQNALLNAFSAIEEDFKGIGKVSLEQLQKYKEGWAEFVPEKAYKGQPIAGAVNDVRNKLAGLAREKIYNSLGENVKQAYLDYSNLFGIKELGKKAMTGVTNIIKGGTGTTIKNILEHVTIPAGTVGGQVLYKVGQGLEFFGPAGVKTLGALLGIPSTTSSSQTPGVQKNQSPASPPPVQ